MSKHTQPDYKIPEALLNIHAYFNRLDGTKSETAKEIINEIEKQVLTQIQTNATGVQIHGKSEIR